MATYPDSAYTPVMDVYSTIPEYLKERANKILKRYSEMYAEGEAPPEDMLRDLNALLSGNDQGGLEERVGSAASSGKWFVHTRAQSAAGLVLLIASMAALASGIPYVPLA